MVFKERVNISIKKAKPINFGDKAVLSQGKLYREGFFNRFPPLFLKDKKQINLIDHCQHLITLHKKTQ
jgi:hypothetical protein